MHAASPLSSPVLDFQKQLLALIPNLRAFSRTLCGRRGIADDMAQEALAKAWRARARFEPGTNLKAWLFTILRNEFYSHVRRDWRQANWDPEKGENIAAPADAQDWSMELSDTARALRRLPVAQREALILVAAGGFSYEDAAAISGVCLGTVKSRVARARIALQALLDGDDALPPAQGPNDPMNDILAQLSALAPSAAHDAVYA
ncbi:MAG TPA: sigma-70 family RNA polymerase sigma factor [Rhizomicrobium sp.]